jgi:hypothetical protein
MKNKIYDFFFQSINEHMTKVNDQLSDVAILD